MAEEIDATTILMMPAKDREHLSAWIKHHTGLEFPNQTVSRFSDSNPFEFIWTVYSAIMDGRPLAVLGLAGRDSLKTLALSVIDLLSFLHDKRHTIHIAMTSAQASRARNYLEKFISQNAILSSSVIKQNTREIVLSIDGREVGMELISATPKAVQGGHCALLTFDEVASSMEPSNVRAYRDAHGILGSSEDGKPAVIVKITSRQSNYSLAEEELRNAAESGLKIMKWTTLDAMERCPDSRSGTTSVPLWINPLKGDVNTQAEYNQLSLEKRDGFQITHDTFDGCQKCPIVAFCAGDSKKQKSKSTLLRTIDDVINKIRLAGSWDWAVAQIMSMKPSSEGLVYFEFDRQVHTPGWDRMWAVLTGQPRKDVTRDQFVQKLKELGANFYAGIDWGWSSPSTCVVMAVDAREVCYVIEATGRTYTSDPDFIQLVKSSLHRKYDIQMYMPDLANGSGNSLIRDAGLPTTDEIDKTISLGVNLVKGLLRVPGSREARFFIAPDLVSQIPGIPGIIEEFEMYHKKIDVTGKIVDDDDPADEYDHYLDALRYMVYWLFGRMRMKVGTDYASPKPVQQRKDPSLPSLQQIATQHGLTFEDNRSQTEDPGNDDDAGGGPIFAWT